MGTQISGSGSTIQFFWFRLHSPGWNQLFLEMDNLRILVVCFYKCNCIHFVVRFFVLTKMPLYFISIEIFSN